jgi:glycosyltransferase involved in cell wall biosynthesis
MVLFRLLEETRDRMGEMFVLALRKEGPVAHMIRELGIPVFSLGLAADVRQFRALGEVVRIMRAHGPDVVQTWMYHADVLGGLAARRTGAKVVWGLHAGAPPGSGLLGQRVALGVRICALLSYRIPDRVVASSQEAFKVHRGYGYSKSKLVLIPNGFGGPAFDRVLCRERVIRELNLPDDALPIARVGRLHPVKDYSTLLHAFRQVVDRVPDAVLLLIGEGVSELEPQISALGLGDNIRILGPRRDVAEILAGCELSISSSRQGEGLPLVIGESMVVETPVVATDVGDSATLIDDPYRIVSPAQPEMLGNAVVRFLELDRPMREATGARDRQQILKLCSIKSMADSYVRLYEQLASRVDR